MQRPLSSSLSRLCFARLVWGSAWIIIYEQTQGASWVSVLSVHLRKSSPYLLGHLYLTSRVGIYGGSWLPVLALSPVTGDKGLS